MSPFDEQNEVVVDETGYHFAKTMAYFNVGGASFSSSRVIACQHSRNGRTWSVDYTTTNRTFYGGFWAVAFSPVGAGWKLTRWLGNCLWKSVGQRGTTII